MLPNPKQLTTAILPIIQVTDYTIAAVNQTTEGNMPAIIAATLIPAAVTTGEAATEDAGIVEGPITNPTTATIEETMIEKKLEIINTTNVGDTTTEMTTTLLQLYLHYVSLLENPPTGMQTPGLHTICQRSNFSSFKEINPGTWKIKGIGGTELFALGIGCLYSLSSTRQDNTWRIQRRPICSKTWNKPLLDWSRYRLWN